MSFKRKGTSATHSKDSTPNTVDVDDISVKYTKNQNNYKQLSSHWLLQKLPSPKTHYQILRLIVTFIAFAARFYKIWYPKEVVFDEVHFGKFASYYLERSYYFDLHPPLAKMAIAFIGWLCGYNGRYKFDNIGDSYETHPAPYLAYRSFNATLGTLTVTIIFNILMELNFKPLTCAFGALLVALDNAQVIETRLIFLDAILIISVAMSVYSYIKFYKIQLVESFTKRWFIWLHVTGVSLSCVISTKYVGVLTYVMIGIAVAVNIWQLLDIRYNMSLKLWCKHVVTRLNGLVFIPFIIYLFWFWVHLTILNTSGSGDVFMSAQFQETLKDSLETMNSKQVNYYDIITLKHMDTEAFLHSHTNLYPLYYEDGRVSSQGQQVTGYIGEDFNNQWQIIPLNELPKNPTEGILLGEKFRLRHIATDTFLLAHDVASPLYPTNEEITTVSKENAEGEQYSFTIFEMQPYKSGDNGHNIKSGTTAFRIIHDQTQVAVWTHNDELLPDWAFNQQEVNGNKKLQDEDNKWIVATIENLDEERKVYKPKVIKKLPFLKKWFELQKLMFKHNNNLSSDHPWASSPEEWPIALTGVSFWTKEDDRKQIFFTGNVVGFCFETLSILVFVVLIVVDLLTRHRSFFVLNKITREKLYGPLAYLFVGWCCHYFPFFLMGRQKFLHHYLPAHLIAALLSAGVWELIFSNIVSIDMEKDEDISGVPFESTPKIYEFFLTFFYIAVLLGVFSFFIFFAPLVYGDVPLSAKEIAMRQWLDLKILYGPTA